MLSPAAVTSVTDPEPQQLTEAGDVGSEDPSGTKLQHKCIESYSKNGQSRSEEKTSKARENVSDQVVISYNYASDWLK